MFRIGIGNDTHRLVEGRPLKLGGVHIACERGGAGHSDADALLHAVSDAILGALCEGDLGMHFPDSDPQWKDADSFQLLSRVVWLAHERNIHIVNVDATIMLETPQVPGHPAFPPPIPPPTRNPPREPGRNPRGAARYGDCWIFSRPRRPRGERP